MIKVRNSMFETNSSNTHTITFATNSDFVDWQNGLKLFMVEDEFLFNVDELDEYYEKHLKDHSKWYEGGNIISKEAWIDEYTQTYDQWYEYDEYLETYVESYTTPGGEEIVAFGRFGRDG